MSNTETVVRADQKEKLWFGHPHLLKLLFSTEMWERFGYYGMRAVLVLYLVQHFVFSDNVANGLYGAFASLVYLTPLIGGFIADQFIGPKRAVKTGAILMSIGYMMLAFTGGDAAKPYVTIDGHRYDVQMKGRGDDAVQYLVQNGAQYKIIGNEDKSITIEGTRAFPAKIADGHYVFDGERNSLNVLLLFASLALVIVGNGYFKPNITTILGTLYERTDRRRDAAYTIFYMGINLGSIISQALVPMIAIAWGYQWGFAFAGVGMCFAWARFQFAGKQLEPYGNPPKDAKKINFLFAVGTLAAVPVVWFLLHNTMTTASVAHQVAATGILSFITSLPILGQVMFISFFTAVIGLPIWAMFSLKPEERDRMAVACVLTCFSVVFFTLFEQAGSSLTLYADRNTDLVILAPHHVLPNDISVFGLFTIPAVWAYVMPAGQVQIFNPLFIVMFAPLFTLMWNFLSKHGIEPTAPLKFAFGLILVGLGFLALVFGSQFHDAAFRVPLFWLVFAYFLHSMGELCLSPVGLSAVSKLSVPKLVGMMFGVWLMASAMAQYVGGIVAQLASTETVGGKVLNAQVSMDTYMGVFKTIGIAGIIAGGVAILLWPILKRGMHGIR